MIGVFDSGVGGLTVLGAIRSALPSADICFLADRKNAPYGTKSEPELLAATKGAISKLQKRGAGKILMACCTASTVYRLLSPEERRICIPIINPTARRAAEITKCRRIGVIATERTVKSHAFKNELREILPDAEVTEIPAQCLVSLAEECDSAAYASTKAINEIEKILSPIKEICPDTLILGCTHFPIFKQIISDRLPDTAIVSCSQEGARALSSVSEDEGCGRLEFIF
jgi:glutamate racemase